MPELPEVETIVHTLAPHLGSRTIVRVEVREARLREPLRPSFARELAARRIDAVTRRGKAIVIEIGRDQSLLVQLGMTGRLTLQPGSEGPARPHDHVRFHLDDGRRVVFNDVRRFGWLRIVPTEQVAALLGGGLEPMAADFDAARLFRATRGRRVAIKSLLMDQRVVLGIGNIYANEVLFHAGIRPRRRAARLTRGECGRIVETTRAVLREAIASGGSTISDYRDGFDRFGTYQHRHHVYDRAGAPCRVCRTPVRQCRVVGRSSFYCARCQR